MLTYIHTYIHKHPYIHTYIHTYTHIYIHTYIHTHLHTYKHTYIHTYKHKYIHGYVSDALMRSLMKSKHDIHLIPSSHAVLQSTSTPEDHVCEYLCNTKLITSCRLSSFIRLTCEGRCHAYLLQRHTLWIILSFSHLVFTHDLT